MAKVRVTVGKFDSMGYLGGLNFSTLLEGKSVAKAKPLQKGDYTPRGGTPLRDAVIQMVKTVETQLEKNPSDTHIAALLDESGSMGGRESFVIDGVNEFIDGMRDAEAKEGRVMVLIVTDGMENTSQSEPGLVQELVKAKEAAGWKFTYIGANHDPIAAASAVGIDVTRRGSTYQSSSSGAGLRSTFRKASESGQVLASATSLADYDEYEKADWTTRRGVIDEES